MIVVALGGSSDRLIGSLDALGWAPTRATSLQAAHRLLGQQPFLVGLVVVNELDDPDLAAIDAFLRRHCATTIPARALSPLFSPARLDNIALSADGANSFVLMVPTLDLPRTACQFFCDAKAIDMPS